MKERNNVQIIRAKRNLSKSNYCVLKTCKNKKSIKLSNWKSNFLKKFEFYKKNTIFI